MPSFTALVGIFAASLLIQDSFTVKEIAEYRLTLPVFAQFEQASRAIAKVTHENARLSNDPLFNRDVMVSGDVVSAASEVEARLKFEPQFVSTLRLAGISAHDYTKFALSLFAARLAHGFLKSGALRHVPAGVAADNVAFIDANYAAVTEVLKTLGVEGEPR